MRRAIAVAALLAASSFLCCATEPKSMVAFREESVQNHDEAIIYVYRLRSMLGAMVAWNVRLDGKVVAVLRQNEYVPLHVAPGANSLIIGDQTLALGGLVGGLIEGAVQAAAADNTGAFAIAWKESYYVRIPGSRGPTRDTREGHG